ncbi:hypothetical protein [Streptomyces sp. NPDC001933]|uniref:hypothetical protein n=1 Tax=Streptomyces sp. NPDC001933 TaxID=3364626 RepID=UPI003673D9D8
MTRDAQRSALNNVMVLEMLAGITKAPVPQFIGGGDLSAYLETQLIARLEELLDKMRSLHGDDAITGDARPSPTKGDTRADLPPQADLPAQADVRDVPGDAG